MSDTVKNFPPGVKKAAHYNAHPSGVEVKHITNHMTFNLGSAFKYVVRRDAKGTPVQDLCKALEYLEFQKEVGAPPVGMFDPALAHFHAFVAAEPDTQVRHILHGLAGYSQMGIPAVLYQIQHDVKKLLMHSYDYDPD